MNNNQQGRRFVGREEANRLYAQGHIGPNGSYSQQSSQFRQGGISSGGYTQSASYNQSVGNQFTNTRPASPDNLEPLYTFGNVNTYGNQAQSNNSNYGNNIYGNSAQYSSSPQGNYSYFPGDQSQQYGRSNQVTDSNQYSGLGLPKAYGQDIVKVNKDGRGEVQAFMLANGTILDYAQLMQAHSEGQTDKLILAPNREGELSFRTTPDGIRSNNLDSLPQF